MPKPIDNATAAFHEEARNLRATKDLAVLEIYAAAVRVVGAARNVEKIRRAS